MAKALCCIFFLTRFVCLFLRSFSIVRTPSYILDCYFFPQFSAFSLCLVCSALAEWPDSEVCHVGGEHPMLWGCFLLSRLCQVWANLLLLDLSLVLFSFYPLHSSSISGFFRIRTHFDSLIEAIFLSDNVNSYSDESFLKTKQESMAIRSQYSIPLPLIPMFWAAEKPMDDWQD